MGKEFEIRFDVIGHVNQTIELEDDCPYTIEELMSQMADGGTVLAEDDAGNLGEGSTITEAGSYKVLAAVTHCEARLTTDAFGYEVNGKMVDAVPLPPKTIKDSMDLLLGEDEDEDEED